MTSPLLVPLADIPAIRALAEEQARELKGAIGVHFRGGLGNPLGDRPVAAACLALLCDLRRPASRDAVARLVAKKVGLALMEESTAPSLEVHPLVDGWVLRASHHVSVTFLDPAGLNAAQRAEMERERWTRLVGGINPRRVGGAAALALIAVAVLGAPNA